MRCAACKRQRGEDGKSYPRRTSKSHRFKVYVSLTSEAWRMVPDLRSSPPRRWSESLGQIRWLPRLIDKTRAALAGHLGDYLFGQSPMDRRFLTVLGIDHHQFARIVRDSLDDADVLAALQALRPEGVRALRAWSERLPRRRVELFFIDLDDGYLGQGWMPLRPAARTAAALVTRLIKRVWPVNPTAGLELRKR